MLPRKPKRKKGIITNHRQLKQVLQHLAIAIEQMTEAIAVVDSEGVVHFINTAWAMMHGYESSSELLEKEIDTFCAKKAPMGRIKFCMEEAKKRMFYCTTQLHVRTDGSTFPAKTKVISLRDEGGEIDGFIVLVMDITKAALAEEELTDTVRTVEQLRSHVRTIDAQCNQDKQKQNQLQQKLGQVRVENLKLQQQVAIQSENQQQWEERHDQLDSQAADLLAENEGLQSTISTLEDSERSLRVMVEQLNAEKEQMQSRVVCPEFEEGDDYCRGLEDENLFDPERLKSLADMARRLK